MKLTFLGAANTVTGSSYLLDTGLSRIMIDCGLFQGSREIKERNYSNFSVDPSTVDYLLLTHAHIDHSGLIPKFINEGFKGRIKATPATVDLCKIMLPDCGHIQEVEVDRINRKNHRLGRKPIDPIYTSADGLAAMEYFDSVEYNELLSLTSDIRIKFVDAGHILGSAMIEVWVTEEGKETKIVFSGDLGNIKQPFINDPTFIEEADYLLMESTYGNRLHRDLDNKLDLLRQAIQDTYEKGGNLIIPGFAVGRTQDILYEINLLQIKGVIPTLPIYIDSPMAVSATKLYNKHREDYDSETNELIKQGTNPLNLPNLKFTETVAESQQLNLQKSPNIIISASGMCDAGRIKHHLRHNLGRPESTILFVGYQAEGTLGRRILSGEKIVRIHGEEVVVKAEIRSIEGYSAHADQHGLLSWLGHFKQKPKKVFVVHGELTASTVLAQKIKDSGIDSHIAKWKETVELTPRKTISDAEVARAYQELISQLDKLYRGASEGNNYYELLKKFEAIKSHL